MYTVLVLINIETFMTSCGVLRGAARGLWSRPSAWVTLGNSRGKVNEVMNIVAASSGTKSTMGGLIAPCLKLANSASTLQTGACLLSASIARSGRKAVTGGLNETRADDNLMEAVRFARALFTSLGVQKSFNGVSGSACRKLASSFLSPKEASAQAS